MSDSIQENLGDHMIPQGTLNKVMRLKASHVGQKHH